jgi:hyperosmotically inducible protein
MNRLLHLILICVFAAGISLYAKTPQQSTPADNTKNNQRDRDTGRATADQQKGNRSDVEITRQIRRSITDDKALSSYAKNVKIVTQNGNVTLRGPVRSDEERKSVEAKAADIAGTGHVKSEIQIAAKQNTKKNP